MVIRFSIGTRDRIGIWIGIWISRRSGLRRAGALLLYVVYESSYMKVYVNLYKAISEQARGG